MTTYELRYTPTADLSVVAELFAGPDRQHMCPCGSLVLDCAALRELAALAGVPLVEVPAEAVDLHDLGMHPQPGDVAVPLPDYATGFAVERPRVVAA